MLILGIETATPSGSVALMDDDRLLGIQTIWANRQHSRQVLPAVKLLLAAQGFGPADLDAVAVSTGPGSFTGLRVGISIAKGLTVDGKAKAIAVPTLWALAVECGGRGEGDLILPLLDARKDEVYGQWYRVKMGLPRAIGEPFACTTSELIGRWPGSAVVSGEGALRYIAELKRHFGDLVTLAPPERRLASAAAVCSLGRRILEDGSGSTAESLKPLYLRDSGAKLKA